MDDTTRMRPRRSRGTTLLCFYCCCFGSNGSTSERSLLRPSWFHKIAMSNSGAMDEHSHQWWRKGWNSVRRAGEWSESLLEDYAGCCCTGAKWKHFVRRCKADGKTICDSRRARFHYDQMSYQLNFDDGDSRYQGMSERMNFPASSKLTREAGTTTACSISIKDDDDEEQQHPRSRYVVKKMSYTAPRPLISALQLQANDEEENNRKPYSRRIMDRESDYYKRMLKRKLSLH
ncbi:hypothetical protein KI387_004476, partial [Taxus chinensis]